MSVCKCLSDRSRRGRNHAQRDARPFAHTTLPARRRAICSTNKIIHAISTYIDTIGAGLFRLSQRQRRRIQQLWQGHAAHAARGLCDSNYRHAHLFFSPYSLINHPPQQSGGNHHNISAALKSVRVSGREHEACMKSVARFDDARQRNSLVNVISVKRETSL
jgi:hypothetical protein